MTLETMAPPADPMDGLAQRLIDALDQRMGAKAATKSASLPYDYGYFAQGLKHDVAGNPITVGYSHGPGGNLSYPGVDPAVFHTVVGNRGIIGSIPWTPSLYTNPLYAVITGVAGDTGSEKNLVCDDAPVAGLVSSCMLTSVFGRYERQTAQIELNRLGQRVDRADPMDLALVGSPIQSTGIFSTGPADSALGGDVLRNETARKFWELGTSLHRLLSVQAWQGSPVNNTGGGGYKEMTGISVLVNTGHTDAQTGVACASVDSDVKDFNFLSAEDNGAALVNALTFMYYTRKDFAERTGVMPVRWVLAMRPEVFYTLSAIWPCAYLTYRCNLGDVTGAQVIIDAADQGRMRDEMRSGRYLLIDGDRIEVVVDDGIPEDTSTTNGNVPEACFASDIYLLPMSVVGGRAVLYGEYFEFTNPSISDALGNMILGRVEGPWITVPKQTNWCIQWQTKIEPRIVLRTPWLAARLNNVVVCPLQRTPSPFPSDPYYVGAGGLTSRSGPSYYSPWQS